MEKELFYANLTALKEYFGSDAVFVSLRQAAKYCKKDSRTLLADKTFPIKQIGRQYSVPIISLARWLA